MSDKNTVEIKTRLRRTRRLRMGQNKSQTDGSAIAAIRISGLYLHDLGFEPYGFFDMVIQDDGSLSIKPVPTEEGVDAVVPVSGTVAQDNEG